MTQPPFPGKEKNLLRAQIARISAATHISPTDFYQFGESEDGETQIIVRNPEYETMLPSELANPSLDGWVHHTAYLLPQGRTQW